MKNKIKIILFGLAFLLLLCIYFYPVTTDKRCGEFDVCKVKFGVYICDVTTEAGQGENTGYLETNLRLYKKIGGIAEYFGLKDIKCNYK